MYINALDFETKVSLPTQQLFQLISSQIVNSFLQVKAALIEFHSLLAQLGLQLYNEPVATSKAWYSEAVYAGSNTYAILFEQVIPEAQKNYNQMIATITDFGSDSGQFLQTVADNPDKITVQTIDSINKYISEVADVSTEQWDELQTKSSELIGLLIEQPLATLENIYTEALLTLMNSYFELVSNILVTI